MENNFRMIILTEVEKFNLNLPKEDQAKISAAMVALKERRFENISVKQLRGDLKELRVKRYRLIFFIHKNDVWVVKAFIKKNNKTPKSEIDLAEKYYKLIISGLNK